MPPGGPHFKLLFCTLSHQRDNRIHREIEDHQWNRWCISNSYINCIVQLLGMGIIKHIKRTINQNEGAYFQIDWSLFSWNWQGNLEIKNQMKSNVQMLNGLP